jgi:hypothetical protein
MDLDLFGTDGKKITPNDLKLSIDRTIYVPFPENYPSTFLYKELDVDDEDHVLARIKFSFPSDKINTMYINRFYVNTHPSMRKENKDILPEMLAEMLAELSKERQLTKGLGKRLLCAAVRQALESGHVDLNGFIELEASGGKCFV